MSLFDVLKYSGTDLDSVEELSKLPRGLFNAYRKAAYNHYGTEECPSLYPLSEEIAGMADDWCDDVCRNIKQIIFNRVLKEWNDESI